jgi:hypothetical protein
MDARTRKMFQIVFQEAHVIDVDFSKWDRRLRLVVSAGLVGDNFQARGPLQNIDFVDVSELQWRTHHSGIALDSSKHHFQWVVMEFSLQRRDGYDIVRLSGFGPAPALDITCRDVRISELDPSVIDRLNPHWNEPYRPLARPGFEELEELSSRRGD